ncbi:autotransporter [Rhodanobacter sp. FW510-R12]|uniref:outer membrane beta-barrel protein n=1 Tax=unclassified Rhodanobacter TaxID=2621553 RepID=UPI0007AA2652|nr:MULTISPECIES: outer membrane beta-barrel protein [unclassified Rhodanobacter]KZC15363.1 autotransporter [Rhodanobacter sp. FW104-R8]KZC25499.1 autotransporter [Rhodanobacter sp. FW510-T8]KZC30203.1 autotransporter [Rhodanobacter sp. FW510-R10]
MKKTFLALAITAAALGTLPAFAQDNPTNPAAGGNFQPSQPIGSGNWFINGSVGQAHMRVGPYGDHPTTYALNGGYRWKVGQDLGLGVEVGYNDLGNFKLKNAFNSNAVNLTSQRQALRGWTAGANGKINVWQGLYLSGRTGIYGWKGDGYSNQDINRHHLDRVDYYAGAGVGYDFSERFGLGLAYDYYHAKKDHIGLSTDTASLTAEYRF